MDINAANNVPSSSELAALASELVLISSIMNNVNRVTVKKDSIYVLAASIGLLSNYVASIAAYKEGLEQQIAPGVTTFANNLKISASSLSLVAGLLSYWALLIETSLRAQGIAAPQTPGTTGNTAVTGSLLVT